MTINIAWIEGLDYGVGVQYNGLIVRGYGVNDRNGEKPSSEGDGSIIVFNLSRTETIEELYSSLNIDASVEAHISLIGGANPTFNFAQEQKFHSFSQYLVASITVTKPFSKIPRPQLDPKSDASKLISSGNKERFFEEFGDSFVLGITSGGAFYAVLEFFSTSSEENEQIKASLNADLVGLVSTTDSFKSTLSKMNVFDSLRVRSVQIGGTDKTQKITVEGISTKAETFGKEVAGEGGEAIRFLVTLQDYKSLELPPSPNFVDIQNQSDVIKNYITLRKNFISKINDIEFILSNPEQFIDVNSTQLNKWLNELTKGLDELTQNASKCVNDITTCKIPTDITIPAVELPNRVVKIISLADKLLERSKSLLDTAKKAAIDNFSSEFPGTIKFKAFELSAIILEIPVIEFCKDDYVSPILTNIIQSIRDGNQDAIKNSVPLIVGKIPKDSFARQCVVYMLDNIKSNAGKVLNPTELALLNTDFDYAIQFFI